VAKVQTLADNSEQYNLINLENRADTIALMRTAQLEGLEFDVVLTERVKAKAQPKRKREAQPLPEWGEDDDEASDDTGRG
jgi:hypothetical protein